MPGDVLKDSVIRLPITLFRSGIRGSRWQAELALPPARYNPFTVDAATEGQARQDLTSLVIGALDLARQRPVLVIGGDGDYTGHVHVINPEPGGWVVHVIRDGRVVATWFGDGTLEDALSSVVWHIGDTPAVVRL